MRRSLAAGRHRPDQKFALDFHRNNLPRSGNDVNSQWDQSAKGGFEVDIKRLEEKLIGIENEADREMTELYRSLFNIPREFLETMALKDLYEKLEKVIDRCRDR